MRGFEVWANQPLRPPVAVVKILLSSILLVDRSSIVFSYELEEPSPLILPHPCTLAGGDEHLVAVPVTGQVAQHVTHSRVVVGLEVCAVRLAHVALLILYGPCPARQVAALVELLLHGNIVENTAQLALCLLGVPGADHGPGNTQPAILPGLYATLLHREANTLLNSALAAFGTH